MHPNFSPAGEIYLYHHSYSLPPLLPLLDGITAILRNRLLLPCPERTISGRLDLPTQVWRTFLPSGRISYPVFSWYCKKQHDVVYYFISKSRV